MWDFDQNLASGKANQGDNQNGKGDFFADLTALLLENCYGKVVALPALAAEQHPERTSEPPPDAPTISADVAPGWHFVGLGTRTESRAW